MLIRLFSAALLLTLAACNKHDDHDDQADFSLPAGTPTCVAERIQTALQADRLGAPETVTRYTYLGDTVFLFSASCCDKRDDLYDTQCNFLCAPSGGFSGAGDGRCADFFARATNPQEIWKKPQ